MTPLQVHIMKLREQLRESEQKLAAERGAVKSYKTLISGDRVVEFNETHDIKISTHTPDKWVMLDLEDGRFYRWDVRRKTWASPPKRATAVMKGIINELKASSKADQRKAKGKSKN